MPAVCICNLQPQQILIQQGYGMFQLSLLRGTKVLHSSSLFLQGGRSQIVLRWHICALRCTLAIKRARDSASPGDMVWAKNDQTSYEGSLNKGIPNHPKLIKIKSIHATQGLGLPSFMRSPYKIPYISIRYHTVAINLRV